MTLTGLLYELKRRAMYGYKRTSLANLLKGMGFHYRKDDNNRGALMEKPYMVTQRRKFLKKCVENLDSVNTKPIVVLSETWIYANGSARRSWQDEDVRSLRRSVGEGCK